MKLEEIIKEINVWKNSAEINQEEGSPTEIAKHRGKEEAYRNVLKKLETLESSIREAYKEGMIRGIWLYAHSGSDGIYYVGTARETLIQAYKDIDRDLGDWISADLD